MGSLISFSSSSLSTLYSLVVLHKSKETISPTQSTRNKTVQACPLKLAMLLMGEMVFLSACVVSDTVLGSMGGGGDSLRKSSSQDGDTLSREKEAITGREVLGMWR